MANKVIELTSDVKTHTGLEVYRDISMKADLNLANILKSYKEVVPMIELSGGYKPLCMLSAAKLPDVENYTLSLIFGNYYGLLDETGQLTSDKQLNNGQEYVFSTADAYYVVKCKIDNDDNNVIAVFSCEEYNVQQVKEKIELSCKNAINERAESLHGKAYNALYGKWTLDSYTYADSDVTYCYTILDDNVYKTKDDIYLSNNIALTIHNPTSNSLLVSEIAAGNIDFSKPVSNKELYLSDISNYMIQGEISALDFVKLGFNIKAQVSDTYYIEDFNLDFEDFTQYLYTEPNNKPGLEPATNSKLVKVEGTNDVKLLLLSSDGQVSAFANWRETLMWNPYKLAKLVNVQAIYNSLHNIFTWTPGERILNPEFGNNLRKYLYEGITEFTAESITAEIRRCIAEYEPRVRIVSINNVSNINDTENNTILIDIVFTIPSLSKELFVYSYTYKYNNNE